MAETTIPAAVKTPVRAHVVLKRPDGASAGVRRVEVPPAEWREQARALLQEWGFTIRRVSPLSILVEAPPDCFERVFQAIPKLRRQRAQAVRAVAPIEHWTWETAPRIPTRLLSVVDDVVLPQPAQVH